MSDRGAPGSTEVRSGKASRLAVLVILSAVAWDLVVLTTAARLGWPPAADLGWAAALIVMSAWFARRVATQTARAADAARRSARLACFQALHDTVVATLVAIARGGLDHRSAEVRQRCARDADYIRRLLLDDPPPADSGLDRRLADVVAAAEDLDLRVRYRPDPAAAPVPPAVAEALAEATREALNNVRLHAQVSVCWVTVLSAGPAVTVRIVDRGRGFRPGDAGGGFGLPLSIAARMRAAGGVGRVLSAPGEGTTVDLSWPA
ncbi:MAG TPA: ATP-binding protein [Actinoplanes sp.]|nr:ATP-binding protein [Actinoplanes sp.]